MHPLTIIVDDDQSTDDDTSNHHSNYGEKAMRGHRAMNRFFELSGRSNRAEYWQWVALSTVVGWIAATLDAARSDPYDPSYKFSVIVIGVTLIPSFTVGIRRLHDIGKTGWYFGACWVAYGIALGIMLLGYSIYQNSGDDILLGTGVALACLAFLYNVYLFILLIRRGDEGDNAYGPPPSYDDHAPGADAATSKPVTSSVASLRPQADLRQSGADPLVQIERLAKLRDAGALTEEEFAQQKASYLERL